MKTLHEYINEGRTNPTAISKSVKTWIMECAGSDSFQISKDMVGAIIKGMQQGIHELEKKSIDENTMTYIKYVLGKIINC